MKNNIRIISCILLSLLIVLSGCGLIPSDQTSTTADPIVKHDLYFDIDFDGNIFLDKYGLDLYINDSKIKSLSNGEDLTEKQTLPEGTYTVKFVSDKDPNINIEKTVKLYTDVVFKCWLKTHEDYIECNDLTLWRAVKLHSSQTAARARCHMPVLWRAVKSHPSQTPKGSRRMRPFGRFEKFIF